MSRLTRERGISVKEAAAQIMPSADYDEPLHQVGATAQACYGRRRRRPALADSALMASTVSVTVTAVKGEHES
jgi:hypothetical protein